MNININKEQTSFTFLLTVIFFCAKIFHYIDWSWVWVFSPLWIPLIVVLAIFSFCAFIAIISAMIK